MFPGVANRMGVVGHRRREWPICPVCAWYIFHQGSCAVYHFHCCGLGFFSFNGLNVRCGKIVEGDELLGQTLPGWVQDQLSLRVPAVSNDAVVFAKRTIRGESGTNGCGAL